MIVPCFPQDLKARGGVRPENGTLESRSWLRGDGPTDRGCRDTLVSWPIDATR